MPCSTNRTRNFWTSFQDATWQNPNEVIRFCHSSGGWGRGDDEVMTGPPPREAATDLITLPGTPLADAVVNLIRPVLTPSVFNHSARGYLFARPVAGRLDLAAGQDYDDDLLFAACVMHDLGVASDGPHRQRFEVEGADRAAEFLMQQGDVHGRRRPGLAGRRPAHLARHRGTPRHAPRTRPRGRPTPSTWRGTC
ncbi:hypothetical protein ACIGXM_21130 [Kitasatospora sp. NPDC052896]|uniref:hypothetical protein n=1 Tax=Kitasatospora sp. NPDC052896 TaxID=3364061 RepID=UPI0037C72BC4